MQKSVWATLGNAAFGAAALFAEIHPAWAQSAPKLHKLLLQVSDEDKVRYDLAIGQALAAKRFYDGRGEQVQIEIVTYGRGITMFRSDTSPVKDSLEELRKTVPGIALDMDANAKMLAERRDGHEIVPLPGVQVVPAAIAVILQRQEEGYFYVRP
jgi:intracellular sulfur oxidation DsrE/DsrF family protein